MAHKGPEKAQTYSRLTASATLDSMTKQCSEVVTDGEGTQEQIDFTVVFKAL